DVEPDGFAHRDEVFDLLGAFGRFRDAQRTRLHINFHARAFLEVFDDLQSVCQHAGVFRSAAQLAQQSRGATGRTAAETLAFEDDNFLTPQCQLHGDAQTRNAATDDDDVGRSVG